LVEHQLPKLRVAGSIPAVRLKEGAGNGAFLVLDYFLDAARTANCQRMPAFTTRSDLERLTLFSLALDDVGRGPEGETYEEERKPM
jgi:hypothetical protein